MQALDAAVIWMNRARGRLSRGRYDPCNVLLLLPHCLQNRNCAQAVREDIRHCKRCGRCRMKELCELADRCGVAVHVASGGRDALERARRPEVRVIVAVACGKELAEGIRGAFPKRVIGVLNSWPHGACKDTDVDPARVEQALAKIIRPPR